mmetsp:Transcript_8371/g.13567  ORF Transcript_8371/g.13567 Transcript_8371/m.13567 type:complete len:221 (+) Transcript_8371:22-684(+)
MLCSNCFKSSNSSQDPRAASKQRMESTKCTKRANTNPGYAFVIAIRSGSYMVRSCSNAASNCSFGAGDCASETKWGGNVRRAGLLFLTPATSLSLGLPFSSAGSFAVCNEFSPQTKKRRVMENTVSIGIVRMNSAAQSLDEGTLADASTMADGCVLFPLWVMGGTADAFTAPLVSVFSAMLSAATFAFPSSMGSSVLAFFFFFFVSLSSFSIPQGIAPLL